MDIDSPAEGWALRPHHRKDPPPTSKWRSLKLIEPLNGDDSGKGDGLLSSCTKSIYFPVYTKDGGCSWFVIPIKDLKPQTKPFPLERRPPGTSSTSTSHIEDIHLEPFSKMPPHTAWSLKPVAVPPNLILALAYKSYPNESHRGRIMTGSKKVLYYDLHCPEKGWQSDFPDMHTPRVDPFAALVDGKKLYVIGSKEAAAVEFDHRFAEVYDIEDKTWKPLPFNPPLISTSYYQGGGHALFLDDENNHRHLFLNCSPSNYTLDLDCPSLHEAEQSFPSLPYRVAVLDGVLYGYNSDSEDIRAYDLVNKVWFPDPLVGLGCETLKYGTFHLFHIGGKRLILVHVLYIADETSQISCQVFTVKREGATKLVPNLEYVGSYIVHGVSYMSDCIIL